jgi:hypothetical protein
MIVYRMCSCRLDVFALDFIGHGHSEGEPTHAGANAWATWSRDARLFLQRIGEHALFPGAATDGDAGASVSSDMDDETAQESGSAHSQSYASSPTATGPLFCVGSSLGASILLELKVERRVSMQTNYPSVLLLLPIPHLVRWMPLNGTILFVPHFVCDLFNAHMHSLSHTHTHTYIYIQARHASVAERCTGGMFLLNPLVEVDTASLLAPLFANHLDLVARAMPKLPVLRLDADLLFGSESGVSLASQGLAEDGQDAVWYRAGFVSAVQGGLASLNALPAAARNGNSGTTGGQGDR